MSVVKNASASLLVANDLQCSRSAITQRPAAGVRGRVFAYRVRGGARSAMLRDVVFGSASDVAQVVGSIGTPVVALAAIGASLWTTRRTLEDRREDRLWGHRSDLYVDLVRLVRQERKQGWQDVLMTIDTLDRMPETYWQSERDRDPRGWGEREVRVLAYASDQTRSLYFEWDHALLRLAGVIHPERVTGVARPDDIAPVVQDGIKRVMTTGDLLLEQIRDELRSGVARQRWPRMGRVRSAKNS